MSAHLLSQFVNKTTKLGDRLHLNREQAQNQLESDLLRQLSSAANENEGLDKAARDIMIDVIKVMYNSERWEDRFGAINASIIFLKQFYQLNADGYLDSIVSDFVWNNIRAEKVPKLMTDPEFRVRNQVGPLLKEMILKD